MNDELADKLMTMPIKELREFVNKTFHSLPHTVSFIILLNRLEQMEEKLNVAEQLFIRIGDKNMKEVHNIVEIEKVKSDISFLSLKKEIENGQV
jgi:hypothetical protein